LFLSSEICKFIDLDEDMPGLVVFTGLLNGLAGDFIFFALLAWGY